MNNELVGVIKSEGKIEGLIEDESLSITVQITESGPKGDKGDQGEVGPKGDKGDTGEQGPQGPKGDKGDVGPLGPQGEQGNVGPKGDKGDPFVYEDFTANQLELLKGPKGDKGDVGPEGPQGEIGPQGPKGDKGDKGDTGELESLTSNHVTDALGYTPADATNEHTHTNKSTIDKLTEVDNKPYYNGEEIGGAVPNLTLNELILGGRYKIAYNDIEDSLDIEVI